MVERCRLVEWKGTREDHMSESNGKSLLVRYGGKLEIHGQPKRSWTKLTATLKPDSENTDVVYDHTKDIRKAKEDKNQFRVYDALETLIYGEPTGKSILRRYVQDGSTWAFAFQKGDRIAIASTDYGGWQAEEAEVVFCDDCSNTQIRINKRLKYTHWGEFVASQIDMRGEVAMLSRNIVIQGEMLRECPSFNGNCEEKEIHKRDTFGAHIKILNGFGSARMSNFEMRYVGQHTDKGRYPIHFHMALDRDAGVPAPYVRSVSIHNSFARRPAGFWITNPKTYFRNNVAAGGEGMGIWVVYPNAPLGPSAFIDPPLMKDLEAQRTPFSEFVNNAAHSQDNFGVFIGGRLKADRTTHCCNMWQPRVNTSDPDSEPLIISLSKITGYKCRFINIWIEGGLLDVSRVSSSDALNGVMVTNEGQQFVRGGKLSNAVIEKAKIRVFPSGKSDAVQSGLTMWKGPMKFNNLWFDGFHDNERYDIAAIAQKRNSPYFSSMKNTFTNITFAFIDGLQVHGNFEHRRAIFVRDQLPSAQLDFEMHIATGPQVVLDGSSTYTVHFKPSMGDWIRIEVNGLDEGDKLRIGVCTPLSAEVEIQSLHPFNFWHRSQFLEVASLEELDRDEPGLDGKKVFFDTKTGMMYYKFINLESRHPDEDQSCNNGKCPEFRVRVISGDYNDSDCRSRLYTAKELARTRDFGAGSLFPFEGRVAIDGGWTINGEFTEWTRWSKCKALKTNEAGDCNGRSGRKRSCTKPATRYNGEYCAGSILEVKPCLLPGC
ncbi:LOW QUALITY PROTEIN: CEIP2-like protein [Mya arenaria]|uniref:CEIP2-like protein n=1 Tax=Mya arenaria TaxID=6604 RepID=A0ABY7EN41_MYAAR|nr:LOW QUALITY PROTEIN: CEIP2-like protein [Mya arenaria]